MLRWIALTLISLALAGCGLAPPDHATLETAQGIHLVRVMEGDDARWATTDFDDANWPTVHWPEIGSHRKLLWLRARVDGATIAANTPVFVTLSAAAAAEIYWNGVRIGSAGTPGTSPTTEIPGPIRVEAWVPPALIAPGQNLLAIKLSSFHLPAKLSRTIYALNVHAGTETVGQRALATLPRFVAAGALLLGACYFLSLFATDRRNRAALFLALLSLASIGQLATASTRTLINYEYPFHVVRLWGMVFFSYGFGAALLALVTERHAPAKRPRYLIAAAICTLPFLAFWPSYDVKIVAPMLIAAIAGLVLVLRSRPRSWLLAGAMVGFLVTFVLLPTSFMGDTAHVLTAGMIVVLSAAHVRVLSAERAARHAAQLRAARLELELLKQHLQPHFLMNTLTTLCEWVEQDPATGVRMIEALAEELRLLSTISTQTHITLGQEIELCRAHLAVMSFRRNAAFVLETQGADHAVPVPPAILHTMIENSLTHNDYPAGARFTLRVSQDAGRHHYVLLAPHSAGKQRPSSGTGLNYVRARLTEYFGEDWQLSHRQESDGWVTSISVPQR